MMEEASRQRKERLEALRKRKLGSQTERNKDEMNDNDEKYVLFF